MLLRFKMILGIGAILLLVILVYAIVASRSQAEFLMRAARREGELVAAVAERALANAMEEGEREVVQAILRRIGEHSDVAAIRIVGPEGTVLRSSRPEEEGRLLGPQEGPAGGISSGVLWDHRVNAVSVFRPILNEPRCAGCHAQDHPTLGFLNVRMSFPAIDSEMAQHWTFMILSTIVCLFAAGGLIWVLFTFVVGRRIEALAQTMSRVDAGDLTARVVADRRDELGRLGESFNTMVAHLAEARRQLEDRHAEQIRRAENLASLGKMAAGIAHEINNPLAGMQNCVRTLLKGPTDEGQRAQYLALLQDGLARIARTVGELLNFAREAKPQMARTDIAALLRRCLSLVEHEMAARRVACSLSPDGRLPALRADPHQIEQVFLNILMNAIEAMPGGGRLTVSAGLREGVGPPCIEIRVADTGIGIPPEHLPRIFDPFFTTKEVGKGTGLGLSVSYGIVRGHGGSINVRSAVGQGTTVSVVLPADEE
jgi:signal transduction histidine kinase